MRAPLDAGCTIAGGGLRASRRAVVAAPHIVAKRLVRGGGGGGGLLCRFRDKYMPFRDRETSLTHLVAIQVAVARVPALLGVRECSEDATARVCGTDHAGECAHPRRTHRRRAAQSLAGGCELRTVPSAGRPPRRRDSRNDSDGGGERLCRLRDG